MNGNVKATKKYPLRALIKVSKITIKTSQMMTIVPCTCFSKRSPEIPTLTP